MFGSLNKKTIIMLGSCIIGFVLVIVLISFIVNKSNTYVSYAEFESKLEKAAKKYYTDKPDLLPTEEEYELSYQTLVDGEYILPLNKLIKNSENCSAYTTVYKTGDTYSYDPYLYCKDTYETKALYKKIIEDNPTVTEGTGLYQGENNYYFRGENSKNYVLLDETPWKIIKINSDNTITIMQTKTEYELYLWDDRYNSVIDDTTGYNDFEVSRIRDTLIKMADNKELLSDTAKSKLVSRQLCIGKRALTDTDKTNKTECSVLTKDKYLFGLVTVSDYLAASIDNNCNVISDKSCSNYNDIDTFESWTITGTSDNNYGVYKYTRNGMIVSKAEYSAKIYLTTNITKRAVYKSGTGTLQDPYIIK